MKNFIEVKAVQNGGQLLLNVDSIALVEQFSNGRTRIVMKERVEKNGNNLEVICESSYYATKAAISSAQE